MSYSDCKTVVENGRVIDAPQRKAIVALFKQSREVMDNLKDVYAYLKARDLADLRRFGLRAAPGA